MDYNYSNLSDFGKACYKGNLSVVQMHVENEEDIPSLIEKRETLLRMSAIFHPIVGARQREQGNTLGVLKYLMKIGANVNAKDCAGYSVLFHCLTAFGNDDTLKMAKVLIDAGADPNLQNRFGCTALHENIMVQNYKAIDFLAKNGANPMVADNDGITPHYMARLFPQVTKMFSKAGIKEAKNQRSEAKASGDNGCFMCHATGSAMKRCTRCLVAFYCDRKCQKAPWPAHKKKCKEHTKNKVPLTETGQIEGHDLCTTFNYTTGQAKTAKLSEQALPKSQVKVKIQIPLDGTRTPLLMYDKNKSFQTMIQPSDPNYDRIVDKVKSEGVFGMKGYFMAARGENGNLEIQVENILTPEKW